eukprot:jgi/Ulvmu1/5587/UM023_0124.1
MEGSREYGEPLLPHTNLHSRSAFLSVDHSDIPSEDKDPLSLPAHIMGALMLPEDHDDRGRQTFVDPKQPLKLKIVKKGWVMDWQIYTQSPFHTLLHMPAMRFSMIFFMTYITFYASFALFYLLMREECVDGIHHFSHAFYFSVQTSATIGYGGELTPNPNCLWVNLIVTLQTVASLMLDYSMLGIVYARFSSPTLRAWSIRFSKSMFMHMADDRLLLSIRVGNVRSKTILNPTAKMLLAMEIDKGDCDADGDGQPLCLVDLKAHMSSEAEACLSLGLPATVSHVIDDDSPLANLSIQTMAARHMEIVALLNATDAMTSHTVEARHSYLAEDIVLNGQPHGVRRRDDGRLVVDYTCFCARASGDLTLDDAKLTFETASPGFLDSPGVARGVAAQQAEAEARSMGSDELGMPDDDAVPPSMRSPGHSMDAGEAPSGLPGPSSRPPPRRSESGRSRDLVRGGGGSSRRWDSEIALDLDHTALPRLAVGQEDPGRRRSIADMSFRTESFAAIRQQLVSTTTTPPARRLTRTPSPSALHSPSRSSSGTPMGQPHPLHTQQHAHGGFDPACTSSFNMGGHSHSLVAVPEEGSPENAVVPLAREKSAASQQLVLSPQLHDRLVKLCSSVIADRHADQMVKEEAMLLRCEIYEMHE